MSALINKSTVSLPAYFPRDEEHFRDLRRRITVRLMLLYLSPLVLLALYFLYQSHAIRQEGARLHLMALAESQANTLDLYLTERLVNLSNLIDDPRLPNPPGQAAMELSLAKLKSNSEAFVDLGFFDSSGIQVSYAGPYPSLENRVYKSESWFRRLVDNGTDEVITDIYLGFRNQPHFTIAARGVVSGKPAIMRATLAPERMYEYVTSLEGAGELSIAIVNARGQYQLVSSSVAEPLDSAGFVPPSSPQRGVTSVSIKRRNIEYAYSWLQRADWALVVRASPGTQAGISASLDLRVLAGAVIMILIGAVVICYRARRQVQFQMEWDRDRSQLAHAAKLASVGELASGIAHEINNPLAAINEEAGLMKDLIRGDYGPAVEPAEVVEHLDSIHELVFRCRDITHKLLGFVRQRDMDLRRHEVAALIDGVVDGLLGREIEVSNVKILRRYSDDVPPILTDANQLQQVLLNLLNNAVDALEGKAGTVEITTAFEARTVRISVMDSGKGMSPEQLSRIFTPFYTTKQVGKGTGLGLSVSYGIIKGFGGEIVVDSEPGRGSTFTLVLPVEGPG